MTKKAEQREEQLLLFIHQNPGRTATQCAHVLKWSLSSTHRLVKKLVAEGKVRREYSPERERVTFLFYVSGLPDYHYKL
jgi:DNA-binding MarR family transcriptional regulator